MKPGLTSARAPWTVALAFLGIGAAYVRMSAPSVTAGDSGEFITAAATLSLAHAPGYPLYALLGKAFLAAVPWGHAALRVNFFSAAAAAAALALAYALARELGLSRGAALFGAALLAGAPAPLKSALGAEVFALNLAFSLAILLAARRGSAPLAAFLAGLGLANHHTLVLVLPAAGLWWAARTAAGRPWREALLSPAIARRCLSAVLLFGLGFSVQLFLPLRSRREPPLDWGRPRTATALARVLARKDYGSFSLSLGETPPRTLAGAARQMSRFFAASRDHLTLPGALLALLGIVVLWRRDKAVALGLAAFWLSAGPLFIWMANLPFDAQSDGILERFYILPLAAAALAAAAGADALMARGRPAWALFLIPAFLFARSAGAVSLRRDFLVHDYGTGLLRSLPPGAALFMDGGDDTFYTLAFQRFVRRSREDLALFDRGGLVFRSPYGQDFRSLPREAKAARRAGVERLWLARGPLFYATMEERLLPGVPLAQRGFLYQAGGVPASSPWETAPFRSVYQAQGDYRSRALAPYFPFMRGRAFWREGGYERALEFWDRARRMGPDVSWLRANLLADLETGAYDRLAAGDLARAEALYARCLALDPGRSSALSNLGVLWERRGDLRRAADFYERALRADPRNTDALYNRAVVAWREGEWSRAAEWMEKVLAQDPAHASARRYLPLARRRAAEGGGR